MKKVTKQRAVLQEYEVYIAKDGTEFHSQRDCLNYEETLKGDFPEDDTSKLEKLRNEIEKVLETNQKGISPEIERIASSVYPASYLNEDGRPYDVNYVSREAFKKGLQRAYKDILIIIRNAT